MQPPLYGTAFPVARTSMLVLCCCFFVTGGVCKLKVTLQLWPVGTCEGKEADDGPQRRTKAHGSQQPVCTSVDVVYRHKCRLHGCIFEMFDVHPHLFIQMYGVAFLTGPLLWMTSAMLFQIKIY